MAKKPFSDRRWWDSVDELTFFDNGKKPIISKEELDKIVKEANEYRIKHGMPLYGKPDYVDDKNNN